MRSTCLSKSQIGRLVPHVALASLAVAATLFCGNPVRGQFEDARIGFHTQSRQNGVEDPISDFRAFVPITGNDFVTFLDTRLLLVENGDTAGYNLGGGFRQYWGSRDWIWGLNAFSDQRETAAARYRQVGFGAELRLDWLEINSNVYLPFGRERNEFGVTATGAGGADQLVFRGNHLVFGRTFARENRFEQSLRGFDVEFGGKLIDDIRDTVAVNGYLGLYGFENPDLEDIFGVSFRANVNIADSIDFNGGVQHDDFFGTQGTVGLTVYSNVFSPRSRPRRNTVRDRMNDPVTRRGAMVIARGALPATPEFAGTPLTNPDSSEMRFVHVASDAAAGGDGTFENPLNSVAEVAANSIAGDNVYLYAGSVFDGQGPLVLQERQRLFGEGNGMAHTIDSLEAGVVTIPNVRGRSIARAVLQNSSGRGIELATDASVTNVSVVDSATVALWGSDVTGVRIADASFGTTLDNTQAFNLVGASQARIDRGEFATAGEFANAVQLNDTARAVMANSKVFTSGQLGFGLVTLDESHLTATDESEVRTTGFLGIAVDSNDESTLVVDNRSVIATSGVGGYGLRGNENGHILVDNGSTVSVTGGGTPVAIGFQTSTILLDNGASLRNEAIAAAAALLTDEALIELRNGSSISSAAAHAILLQTASRAVMSGGSRLEIRGGDRAPGVRAESNSSVDFRDSIIDTPNGRSVEINLLSFSGGSSARLQNNQFNNGAGRIVFDTRGFHSSLYIEVFGAANAAEVAASNGLPVERVIEIGQIRYIPD